MKITIHADGSCFNGDGRMGLGIAYFADDSLEPFQTQSINKHERIGTSNQAEYLAIINALCGIKRLRNIEFFEVIEIFSDSEIVINQINGMYKTNSEELKALYTEVQRLLKTFPEVTINFCWCPRTNERQKIVDKLSKKANPYFIHKKKYGF